MPKIIRPIKIIRENKPKRGRPPGPTTPSIKVPRPKMGRPATYNPKVANDICEFLAQGMSLTQICRMEGIPSYPTVMSWLNEEDGNFRLEFLNKYRIARDIQADYLADEMIDISDDGKNDFMERQSKNGIRLIIPNAEMVQRSKLRVDTRKWVAARLKPKKYGDSSSVSLTGADGKPLNPQGPTKIIFDFGDGNEENQES
jgi:hypothetical protein